MGCIKSIEQTMENVEKNLDASAKNSTSANTLITNIRNNEAQKKKKNFF